MKKPALDAKRGRAFLADPRVCVPRQDRLLGVTLYTQPIDKEKQNTRSDQDGEGYQRIGASTQ
jgi:hypothetical protein